MPSIFAMNDPNRNLFTEIGDANIMFLASQLDQKDKLNLAKCSVAIYRKVIQKLYQSIIIVVSFNSKSLPDQTKLPFVYSSDVSIISSGISIKKFFKTVNKGLFDYNKRLKFPLLIRLLHVYFSIIPKDHKFIDLNEDDSHLTLENFEDTFLDCYEYSIESIGKFNSISDPIAINLLKLIPNLSFCEDVSIPSSVYAKLYHNLQHYDYLQRKKTERGVYASLSNYYKQLRDGEFFLDLKKIGSGLKFTFLHLTTLRLSFADPYSTKKVLECCNPEKLKTLTLDHINCAFTCKNGFRPRPKLKRNQMSRKIELLKAFFESPKIIKIFRNLDNLQLISHNGYNRVLFRAFFYYLHENVVNCKIQELGTGKLELKSFRIRESTSDFSIIHQVETFIASIHSKKKSDDHHNSSTLTVLTDLLNVTDKLSIFDIFDFDHLKSFELFAKCLPSMMYQKRYEKAVVSVFRKKLMKETAKLKNNVSVRIKVNCYDKGLMIPRDVVFDDVDTIDERLESEAHSKIKEIIQGMLVCNWGMI